MPEPPLGIDWEPGEATALPRIDAARVALGRELFFDPRLSRSGETSCATCHRPELFFTDGRALFVGDGGDEGRRHVPGVLNRAMGASQFWDGRAATLAEQALGPMLSEDEMGLSEELFRARLAGARDAARFRAAFDAPPSLERAAEAIAAWEATLFTGGSPFDRYEWGGEEDALDAAAKRGLALFRGKAGCSTCHVGTNLTDEAFHNLGIGIGAGDAGRAAHTARVEDRGRFKTPSLRNVARTAPYMHDGSLRTLAEVVELYDAGGRPNPGLDPELRPLGLDEGERADLVAFLESLTGTVVSVDPAFFAAGGEARPREAALRTEEGR